MTAKARSFKRKPSNTHSKTFALLMDFKSTVGEFAFKAA